LPAVFFEALVIFFFALDLVLFAAGFLAAFGLDFARVFPALGIGSTPFIGTK